jgi:hypothetical protein
MSSDPVIGLDVGGKLFYCNRSTLTNFSGSYFARRFGSVRAFAAAEPTYKDDKGIEIFFIDRNGSSFEHILEYIRTLTLPPALDNYYQNPKLWNILRIEADCYGLTGLAELLKVTYSCSPNPFHRGVLYWLGTKKGLEKCSYENPYVMGAVHVGGWVDDKEKYPVMRPGEGDDDGRYDWDMAHEAGSSASRAAFVQNRPKLDVIELSDTGIIIKHSCLSCLLSWDQDGHQKPVVIDFLSIRVRPTHFTLRLVTGGGTNGAWNFEGSVDGTTWETLYHAERGLLTIPDVPVFPWINSLKESWYTGPDNNDQVLEWASDVLQNRFEMHNRHTWEIENATEFYRYFRFIGSGEDSELDLSGTGFELYGDVSE